MEQEQRILTGNSPYLKTVSDGNVEQRRYGLKPTAGPDVPWPKVLPMTSGCQTVGWPAGINLDKQNDMADIKYLSDESFDQVLLTLNMMSLKFNGPAYKIFDQDSMKAEEKVRTDIDLYMLLQFDPPRVPAVMLWKLKIAYDFYRSEGQNLSLFDTDVFRFMDVFRPIMEDQRFRAWRKSNGLTEDTSGFYMLVELAYDLNDIRY